MSEAATVTTTTSTTSASATNSSQLARHPLTSQISFCLENTPASSRIQMPALSTQPAHTSFNTYSESVTRDSP